MAKDHTSIGWRELVRAGWTPSLGIRIRNSRALWYIATPPEGHWAGGEQVVLLRQGSLMWHAWGNNWSASGQLPEVDGGLGDVISTDAQLAWYTDRVAAAPGRMMVSEALYRESAGIER